MKNHSIQLNEKNYKLLDPKKKKEKTCKNVKE